MAAYPTDNRAAVMIGRKASQFRPRIRIEEITATNATTIGNTEFRRISSIGMFTARCQASAVCSEERAPAIHADSGRSRFRTRTRTIEVVAAVSPSVIARIEMKSEPETL